MTWEEIRSSVSAPYAIIINNFRFHQEHIAAWFRNAARNEKSDISVYGNRSLELGPSSELHCHMLICFV